MGLCKNWCEKYGNYGYLVFRLLFGLLFFMHGYAKFAGGTPAGLMLVAGVVELVVGAAVFLGFFTRLGAVLGAIQMLVAFFMVHVPQGWNPLANGGEPALLFFAAFLALAAYGNGAWSLETVASHKETF